MNDKINLKKTSFLKKLSIKLKPNLTFIHKTIVFEDFINSIMFVEFSIFLYLIVKFKCKLTKNNVEITNMIK